MKYIHAVATISLAALIIQDSCFFTPNGFHYYYHDYYFSWRLKSFISLNSKFKLLKSNEMGSSGTVVQVSTHNLKTGGSITATGSEKESKLKRKLLPCSIVVQHLTHNSKIKGLNPATASGSEKTTRKCLFP